MLAYIKGEKTVEIYVIQIRIIQREGHEYKVNIKSVKPHLRKILDPQFSVPVLACYIFHIAFFQEKCL